MADIKVGDTVIVEYKRESSEKRVAVKISLTAPGSVATPASKSEGG